MRPRAYRVIPTPAVTCRYVLDRACSRADVDEWICLGFAPPHLPPSQDDRRIETGPFSPWHDNGGAGRGHPRGARYRAGANTSQLAAGLGLERAGHRPSNPRGAGFSGARAVAGLSLPRSQVATAGDPCARCSVSAADSMQLVRARVGRSGEVNASGVVGARRRDPHLSQSGLRKHHSGLQQCGCDSTQQGG